MTKTFVLVHGAWHGGWCWGQVAGILRTRGHRVTTPTQTGLGERKHLMSRDITLDTFTADIVNHIRCEDLSDVVLVGHSFGGNATSGCASAIPDRLSRLVYLDAMVLEAGETPFSQMDPSVVEQRIKLAEDSSRGLSLPPPTMAALGVLDETKAHDLEPRLCPHPLSTFKAPLNITGPAGNGLPASYVWCTDPVYSPLDWSLKRAREVGWRIDELATGHDAMVTAPLATADLLEQLAGL